MSGMSGLDLQEQLVKRDRCMPIVFITGHGDIPMTVQAMKRGAVDFLPKPFDDVQLLGAIDAAIAEHRQARTVSDEAQAIQERIRKLTPREYEVFRYVLTGILNKQIAFELKIAEHTVKLHRGRVMEKLGVNSVADLVRLAQKVGISAV
jgi:FixJ family two-component response regulator